MKTQLHQYLTINLVVIYFADVAREEARKMETAVLVPGTLVQVNRLTNSSSSHGTALNEHYGIVRGTAAADGFLTVEIILGDQGEEADRDRCVDPGTLVSVKPFNLDFIARPDGGYHLLQLYLMNKARSILQKGEIGIHMFESWVNKFAVPGFPTGDASKGKDVGSSAVCWNVRRGDCDCEEMPAGYIAVFSGSLESVSLN